MIRALTLAAAFLAAPAMAAPHYQAELESPAAERRLVVRDAVWTCADATCVTARTGSRPEVVCAALARKAGALRRFSAGGANFGAEELAACNRRAR